MGLQRWLAVFGVGSGFQPAGVTKLLVSAHTLTVWSAVHDKSTTTLTTSTARPSVSREIGGDT